MVNIAQCDTRRDQRPRHIIAQSLQLDDSKMRDRDFLEHCLQYCVQILIILHAGDLRLKATMDVRPVRSAETRIEVVLVYSFPDSFERLPRQSQLDSPLFGERRT